MTLQIGITYSILLLAIILFITDLLRPDLVAMIVMLLLPWTGVISVAEAFSGFSSNAVISVIGVMMLGYGIDRSGIMGYVSKKIVTVAGKSEKTLLIVICSTVGVISSFMQNIGAAALFLPAIRKIEQKTQIPSSRMLMPMGFAAILGGTLTMVASGPLIVLNDLVVQGGYERFNLFSVTPIGASLLFFGIAYFYFLGGRLLPDKKKENETGHQQNLKNIYNITESIFELEISKESPWVGKTIEDVDLWSTYQINILALKEDQSITYAPWRKTRFQSGQTLAILGKEKTVIACCQHYQLILKKDLEAFSRIKDENFAGFAEIIVPPKSEFKGKSLCDIAVRKNFSVEPILHINQDGQVIDFYKNPMETGQEMIVFGRWEDIKKLKQSKDLIVVTDMSDITEKESINKGKQAIFCLVLSIILILLGFRLSLSFFTGAMLMILFGIIPKDEIYRAVDWSTVFLLAGLIPLGIAFERTGAARMTADIMIHLVTGVNDITILLVIGLLTTLFSLFMSNVAATVLLVPLVLILGESFGMNPRGLALLVAICASNSFVLPTHQVNAFLMTPGGYKNGDYLKVGGGMSLIFLIVATMMVYIIYI